MWQYNVDPDIGDLRIIGSGEPVDSLSLIHMNRPCMVGLVDRPSWGQVSLLIHPLGYFDVTVAFRMHLGNGIEQELLVL